VVLVVILLDKQIQMVVMVELLELQVNRGQAQVMEQVVLQVKQ
jgi:hypothetical protein